MYRSTQRVTYHYYSSEEKEVEEEEEACYSLAFSGETVFGVRGRIGSLPMRPNRYQTRVHPKKVPIWIANYARLTCSDYVSVGVDLDFMIR
jgi:hypothetical protein